MVEQSEASVESDKEVSETRMEEEKPLLMDHQNTSQSTKFLVLTKIDETECLANSVKGKLGKNFDFFLRNEFAIFLNNHVLPM